MHLFFAMTKIEINPNLDLHQLQQQYAQKGRLQVNNFFTPQTAEYLHQLLIDNKDWYLAYNEGDQYYESVYEEIKALPENIYQKFINSIFSRARHKFQYVFKQYFISQAIQLEEQPGHPLHQVQDFLNSDEYLNFMRSLTQQPDIRYADSYASHYEPGHFLTDHDDTHAKQDRVAACTFSLTKDWHPNWGGHLVFYDEIGNIEQGFMPTFNTLNVFKIPQRHAVQQVTQFAGSDRLSLLSWLQK